MVLTLGWGVRGLLVCLTYSHFSSGLLFSAGFCLGFPFCVCVCVCACVHGLVHLVFLWERKNKYVINVKVVGRVKTMWPVPLFIG